MNFETAVVSVTMRAESLRGSGTEVGKREKISEK
jgi:hypothetical protein